MKQRVVVAMLAAYALLAGMTFSASAQVKVAYELVNLRTVTTCDDWFSPGVITLTETDPADFFGAPGASSWVFFDLYITLPAGFEFNPAATATWDVPNSANITKVSTGTTYIEYVRDSASATPPLYLDLSPHYTIMVLRGLKVKNTNQTDIITISGLQLRVIPGTGPTPQGDLTADTRYEYGALPTTRPLVRDFPAIGAPMPPSPTLSINPGDAAGVKFEIQPNDIIVHDVQQRVRGEGYTTTSETWPTVVAVDCKGYYSTRVTNKSVTISATALWDGNGPTYVGATPSTTVYGSWTLTSPPVEKAIIPLVFSMNDAGTFQLDATMNATASAVNPATSGYFTVAKRLVSWENRPTLGTPVPNMNGNYDIPVVNDPSGNILDLAGNPVSNAQAVMEIVSGSSSTLPTNLGNGVYTDDTYLFITPDIFFGNVTKAFELTYDEINAQPKPVYTGFLYVATNYYGGGWSSTAYPDPRYYYDFTNVDNNALPVELTAFTAQMRNEVVTLKWTTATETNNYGFEVERSFDRNDWSKVGFVAGSGTTSSQRDYSFQNALTRADLMSGTISYRLRQIDRDGSIEYSPVVTVSIAPTASSMTLLQNFPNPFNPSTNISFNLPESGAVTLTVYNELGIEVARIHDAAQLEAGWHTASFNASALPSGLYSYRLSTPAGSVAKTMIVAK